MHYPPENILKEYCYEIFEQFSDYGSPPSPGVYKDTSSKTVKTTDAEVDL